MVGGHHALRCPTCERAVVVAFVCGEEGNWDGTGAAI